MSAIFTAMPNYVQGIDTYNYTKSLETLNNGWVKSSNPKYRIQGKQIDNFSIYRSNDPADPYLIACSNENITKKCFIDYDANSLVDFVYDLKEKELPFDKNPPKDLDSAIKALQFSSVEDSKVDILSRDFQITVKRIMRKLTLK